MREIQLYKWNITKHQFLEWVVETDADVYRVTYNDVHPIDRHIEYGFADDEDFLAFKLKFTEKQDDMSKGVFYCPYIPLLK